MRHEIAQKHLHLVLCAVLCYAGDAYEWFQQLCNQVSDWFSYDRHSTAYLPAWHVCKLDGDQQREWIQETCKDCRPIETQTTGPRSDAANSDCSSITFCSSDIVDF